MTGRRLTFRFSLAGLTTAAVVAGIMLFVQPILYPPVAELKRRCQDAIEAKDWPEVETVAALWAAADPGSGEPWLQWAEGLRRQRKYQLALNCLKQIPSTAPQNESGMLAQMEMQFGPLNHPAEGAEVCELILISNPKSVPARQRLIFFLALTLQRTRLIHEVRRAIEAKSDPIEAYVYFYFADSLMFSNGIEMNSRWLLGEPDSELFEVGEAVFTAESLDLSVVLDDRDAALATRRAAARKAAVMEVLLAKYPHNSELLAYNIRQQIQSGDLEGVVKLLAQATVDAEEDHRFWRFKGWVHAQRGQTVEAEKSYRRAIALHPVDWSTRNLFAELLQQEKRFDEVKSLRDLVSRGNDLRLDLQKEPNARQVSPQILVRLMNYAADCGDQQISDGLRRHIERNQRS